MGIKKKRGVLSLLFVFMWGVLFATGIFAVFLFLKGFSFFDSRVIQRGYALFSSEYSLFLNGNYIKSSNAYSQYELGKYDLCVDDFEKKELCYDNVEVGANDSPSQHLESLLLLENTSGVELYDLSKKEDFLFFSPDNTSVAWYDSALRQVFYIDAKKEGVSSLFPSFEVVSGGYDVDLGQFEFKGGKKDEIFVIKTSNASFFSDFSDTVYVFSDWFFSRKLPSSDLFAVADVDLLGVYSVKLGNSYRLKNGVFVLFFNTSVYSFSEVRNSWLFLSEKDDESGKENERGFCSEVENKCYFMKNKKLVELLL